MKQKRKKRKEILRERLWNCRGDKGINGAWSAFFLKGEKEKGKLRVYYKIRQPFFFFGRAGGDRTARMPSSNTFFKPFCVSAEHSKYFAAPISFDI